MSSGLMKGVRLDGGAFRTILAAALVTTSLLALTGCDGGSASTPARSQADAGPAAAGSGAAPKASAQGAYGSGGYAAADDAVDHRRDPVPMLAGAPMWANSKKYSAEESAAYHFKRDGSAFGAATEDDFVAKVHAFVSKPPKDVLTLTRDNGDKLLYDPAGNIFAVVTKDGAPRTMFKPDDGQAYWDKQQQQIADQAKGDGSKESSDGERHYSRRSSRGGEDDSEG